MSLVDNSAEASANFQLTNSELVTYKEEQKSDFSEELEELAMLIAETWKDFHPNLPTNSEEAFEACVFCVTTEMATAGTAVAGAIGLEILTGGGSAAAKVVCSRVLSKPKTKLMHV